MSFFRMFSETFNSIFLKLKQGQTVKVNDYNNLVKLNLGCGLAVEKTWINIDGSLNSLFANFHQILHPLVFKLSGARHYYSKTEFCEILRENRFVHHDLSHSIPFNKDTVDFIFSSHFFEHLFKSDAEKFLAESFRVLKSGGTIRISVPDLEYAVNLYSEGQKTRMLEDYFFVDHDQNYFSRHKYMYDFELLSSMLAEAGFEDVKKQKYRRGATPELDVLDNRPEDSLFVEASKPYQC